MCKRYGGRLAKTTWAVFFTGFVLILKEVECFGLCFKCVPLRGAGGFSIYRVSGAAARVQILCAARLENPY